MARYARIQAGTLFEISPETDDSLQDWAARFHPSSLWVAYVEGAAEGDSYDDETGDFSAPPATPIADVRAGARQAIDIAAGEARDRFITSAPGQESVYMMKREQALAYKAAGYTGTVPTMIAAEATAQDMTAEAATDFVLATADAWVPVAALIEQARLTAKVAVNAANTEGAVNTILDDALAALGAITP